MGRRAGSVRRFENAASSRSSAASEAAPHRGTVSRHRGGSAYRVPVNWARGAAWLRRAGPITGPDVGLGRVLPVSASGRRARPGRWMRAKKKGPAERLRRALPAAGEQFLL